MKNVPLVAARAAFTGFFLLTACYCLLAYIPFTYVQVIQFNLLSWLTAFARVHSFLYWVVLALAAWTLREDLRRPETRTLAAAFLGLGSAGGIALFVHPLLARLGNDRWSLLWGLVALAPLFGLAAVDLAGHGRRPNWPAPDDGEDVRLFRATLLAAGFVSITYSLVFLVRFARAGGAGLTGSETRAAAAWSLASHALVFMALFAALCLVRGVARLFRRPAAAEFALSALLLTVLLTLVVRNVVLAAASFHGRPATMIAVSVSASLVAALAGLAFRLRQTESDAAGGLELLVSPLTLGRIASWPARAAWVAGLAGLTFVLASGAARMDWNFLVQKLAALTVWLLAFATFLAMGSAPRPRRGVAMVLLLAPLASLGCYKALAGAGERAASAPGGATPGLDAALGRYADHDVSFRIVRDLLAGGRREPVDDDFFGFLQTHTNISRATPIRPIDVNLVPHLTSSPGPKPDIFIFVVDSLRRDYLSPYNRAVGFTPEIDRFAHDSVVFRNAFTPYGGTGLSEPAIWVGGMIPHQQYVTPFHPLNTLQKLIEAEGYTSFISVDAVLRAVVKPSPSIVELDQGAANRDYAFCRTLSDLEARLRALPPAHAPVFVYTQPQDIHISTITREGRSVPPGETYAGFDAAYASRVRRLDGCFGEFVRYLKSRGGYDRSVVVLTSDHGDSLGEGGRAGHAYTIFPEVVETPLIVHFPQDVRSRAAVDPDAVAFSTDITPTLYALLGHAPALRNEFFGRPLVAGARTELRPAIGPEGHLMVSSYGPVYGILDPGGRSLFIADAVNYQDYFYDLSSDPKGRPLPVTDALRRDYHARIETAVRSLYDFYKVDKLD